MASTVYKREMRVAYLVFQKYKEHKQYQHSFYRTYLVGSCPPILRQRRVLYFGSTDTLFLSS